MKTLIALLAVLLAGASVTVAEEICGPDVKHSAKHVDGKSPLETSPPSDKALIYVLAPTYEAGNKQMKVSADREWIGVNEHHSYFVAALDPGEHDFCFKSGSGRVSELVGRLKLTVEAGKSYFLLQHTSVGFQISSSLEQVSPEDAAILLKKCKRMEFAEKK